MGVPRKRTGRCTRHTTLARRSLAWHRPFACPPRAQLDANGASHLTDAVWVPACDRATLAPGGVREVEAGGAALLLYDVAGTVFATAAICPHHSAWLSQGGVDGEYVDCPRHQGRFHIPTGEKMRGPDCPDLRVYPVRVEGGRVFVAISSFL